MKQLTTRANRPLPHPHTLFSAGTPPLSPSMELTVYSIGDGKQLGLDYVFFGGRGAIEGVACIHDFMVIMAAERSTAWKVGPRLCSAGFYQICKKGRAATDGAVNECRVARVSGKRTRKNSHQCHTSLTPHHQAERQRTRVRPMRRAE